MANHLDRGWVLVVLALAACADVVSPPADDEEPEICQGELCDRVTLDQLGLDPFYEKYLDADGIPVVSSGAVSDQALRVAREIVLAMLTTRADIRQTLIDHSARVGIMAPTEVTTDIPEHRHLANDPDVNWDRRARGLGGTPSNPITTVGEENLLCLDGDWYAGENILVHEFAHSIHVIGLKFAEPSFDAELHAVYDSALAEGLWADTYSETNRLEYWAEAVQIWFYASHRWQKRLPVDTRVELEGYDPRVHKLIGRYFRDDDWWPMCP